LFSGQDAKDDWDTSLDCETWPTWTAIADLNEALPINCVNWYQAAAFCIWDGGFLPSEAEWEYAAAGGAAEREHPWGGDPVDSAHAVHGCLGDGSVIDDCAFSDILVVGTLPAGDGLYEQSDLVGNMWEWTFDYGNAFASSACEDCASLSAVPERTARGASFQSNAASMVSTNRTPPDASLPSDNYGIRCARSP
jgi:formylglycine-generating enzyme